MAGAVGDAIIAVGGVLALGDGLALKTGAVLLGNTATLVSVLADSQKISAAMDNVETAAKGAVSTTLQAMIPSTSNNDTDSEIPWYETNLDLPIFGSMGQLEGVEQTSVEIPNSGNIANTTVGDSVVGLSNTSNGEVETVTTQGSNDPDSTTTINLNLGTMSYQVTDPNTQAIINGDFSVTSNSDGSIGVSGETQENGAVIQSDVANINGMPISDTVSGTNFTAAESGGSETIEGNSNGEVIGSNDQISVDAGSNDSSWELTGTNNNVAIGGSSDNLYVTSGNTVSYGDNVSSDNITASSDTIDLGNGDGIGLVGTGLTINDGSGANVILGSGSSGSINSGGDTFDLQSGSNNDSWTFNASGNTVDVGGSDDNLYVASNNTISYGDNVYSDNITASNDTVDLGNGDGIGLAGNGVNINDGSGTTIILASGSGGSINSAGDTFELSGTNEGWGITGSGNTIDMGSYDSITATQAENIFVASNASDDGAVTLTLLF